jgi:hypothetical protein
MGVAEDGAAGGRVVARVSLPHAPTIRAAKAHVAGKIPRIKSVQAPTGLPFPVACQMQLADASQVPVMFNM